MAADPKEQPQSLESGRFPIFSRLGEAVVQVAASAGEMISDRELRRKAGTLVVTEAGKRIKDIQEGVTTRATNFQKGLNEGPRQVQSLYAKIHKQYLASRHTASLKARRDTPVDVQVGPFLWEDAPQELRSRLWIALLCNPHLIGNLVKEKVLEDQLLFSQQGNSPARMSHVEQEHSVCAQPPELSTADQQCQSRKEVTSNNDGAHLGRYDQKSTSPKHLNAQDPDSDDRSYKSCLRGSCELRSSREFLRASLHSPNCAEPGPSESAETVAGAPEALDDNLKGETLEGESPKGPAGDDAWEIVQDASSLNDFRGSQLSARLQPGKRGAAMTLRERLLEAVWEVAWPISTVYSEGCKYDTLCQISVGQEEIEEVIQRDINRTFPEHPQFSFEQGQQELFRVLKAYSLHDLQVGYCQGMAFVTGVVLMYVPEEPAFRLLTRLMDERGANLRQLYLPGLEGLKNYLRMFEWLLDHLHSELRLHLEAYAVVPVLYASQWFLTAFSCPFPSSFSARVVDVMLTENCGHVMLRIGLVVMKACAPALIQLQDFEDLVTHLKVEPVQWSQQKARAILDEAISGSVDDELLMAAAEAVAKGYDGSLSRRPSNLKSEIAASGSSGLAEKMPSLSTQCCNVPLAVPGSLPARDHIHAGKVEPPTGGNGLEETVPEEDLEMTMALADLWISELSENE